MVNQIFYPPDNNRRQCHKKHGVLRDTRKLFINYEGRIRAKRNISLRRYANEEIQAWHPSDGDAVDSKFSQTREKMYIKGDTVGHLVTNKDLGTFDILLPSLFHALTGMKRVYIRANMILNRCFTRNLPILENIQKEFDRDIKDKQDELAKPENIELAKKLHEMCRKLYIIRDDVRSEGGTFMRD
jgi:hypothetical protein